MNVRKKILIALAAVAVLFIVGSAIALATFVNYEGETRVGVQSEIPVLENVTYGELTLVSVRHDDERHFSESEWQDILRRIEKGEITWED